MLLAQRPPGWEYLFFAAKLLAARDAPAVRGGDHEPRYVVPSSEAVTDAAAPEYLQHVLDDIGWICDVAETLFQGTTLEAAFGPPGEPGDADRIEHLATHANSVYEGLAHIGSRVRSAPRPDQWDATFNAVARFVDRPVSSYRAWVDDVVRECDRIPGAIARGEPLEVHLEWVLEIDGESLAAFSNELHRVGPASGLSMGSPDAREAFSPSGRLAALRLAAIVLLGVVACSVVLDSSLSTPDSRVTLAMLVLAGIGLWMFDKISPAIRRALVATFPPPPPAPASRPPRPPIPKGLRYDVLRRDGFRCQYCGRSVEDGVKLHLDHKVPVARGGPTTIDNLITACESCNLGKGVKEAI